MWQQKHDNDQKITKKPFASNELLVIQDLSLESLHDLRSHRYLRKSRGTLKGDVNRIEYEPTYRNKYENDSICTIENDQW